MNNKYNQEKINEIKKTLKLEKITLYRGVIENNVSPNKDGRVQVRIAGIHDYRLDKIKTEHLPWAEVIQPTAFGFSSGIGFTSIPNKGTWVWCFLDHGNPNLPVVIGTISGKSVSPADVSVGFNDPDGVFPLIDRLNEEDQNRLQRVEKLDKTIHKKINDTLDTVNATDGVSGADVSMNEPVSLSDKSVYPNNSVIETKSGHVLEIDDTPGNERIRMYHKSGTYIDYRPDGAISEKTKKSIDKIIEGYIHTHIKKSVKTYIEKNLDEIINGAVKRNIKKNLQEHINGDLTLTVDGNLTWEIGGNINIHSGGTQTNVNDGNYKHVAPRIDLNP